MTKKRSCRATVIIRELVYFLDFSVRLTASVITFILLTFYFLAEFGSNGELVHWSKVMLFQMWWTNV